ncbi:amino acid oxidase [Pseudomonas aeruginosa]|nr:amino acid oxidase [Pseudomonas aeruginosa]MDA3148666.1 amino acid oxidase [Pseudomonas aeruginosa]
MAEPEKADGVFYGALPASGEALREHAAPPRRQPHADPLP